MPLERISYSRLNLLACSYQTFLRYEGKVKGPPSYHIVLGEAVHDALEKVYKQPLPVLQNLQYAENVFQTELHRQIEEEGVFVTLPILKKIEKEGLEMIGIFFRQMEEGKISTTPIAVEQEFELDILGIKIVGKIDRVDRVGTEDIAVTDYKSGGKKPTEWFLSRDLQFTAYYWAARELYGRYPKKMIYHHLRTGEQLVTDRTEWDIEQLKRSVEAAIKFEENDIRFRIYNKFVCEKCPYAGKICDDPTLEQKILEKNGRTPAIPLL